MIIQNSIKCPLSATEQRHSDCLHLWLETKKNYFTPDYFRISLNNCIQAMRNVTFALQKTKSEFNNFDNWYGGWQEKLRKDDVMLWLISARNFIVKEGDLKTLSKLRISIVETWLASPFIEIDVPPLIYTKDFVKFLAKNNPDNINLKVGLLRAERRWIDEHLKKFELLEALAYVYVVLSDLILNAHENLSFRENLLKCPWHVQQNPNKGQYPNCMKAQEWDRTIWLDLKSGQTLQPIYSPVKKIDDEKVQEHYGYEKRNILRNKPKNLNEEADMLFEEAKNILITDSYHLTIALVGYPDGSKDILGLQMLDRAEKHLAIRSLAADIEKTGAISVRLSLPLQN